MNIRKTVDYSTMFAALEAAMDADLPQMELYCEIGKIICTRPEKGAAVAAAEFLKEQYPDMTGFSPRNVRRMRDFWQLYGGMPELLGEALHLNWTQNVVIMEAELTAEERYWYMDARKRYTQKPYAYIMYIDIGPITRYIVTLNWAFFAVLLAISSVMCLLGFRFGRDIEKEAERQQTFFQNASHELKTPLMAIQGYAEGIQAGVMDTGSAAEVILKESDRMTELVDELLDISKIDMGRQPLTLSEMDVRELLYDSIRAVEPAAAAGGIAIVPDFPETPVMVSCDDTRLRRAVTNILSNGVRYALSQLHLTCRTEKRHVTIRIQDDGDGIAAEDLPHIFDRFYMGKSGKSGIGLALTKEIIHLHKGTIRAYNGDGGAVFEISIPVSR